VTIFVVKSVTMTMGGWGGGLVKNVQRNVIYVTEGVNCYEQNEAAKLSFISYFQSHLKIDQLKFDVWKVTIPYDTIRALTIPHRRDVFNIEQAFSL
jgi:hypothetical protein